MNWLGAALPARQSTRKLSPKNNKRTWQRRWQSFWRTILLRHRSQN